MKVAVVHNVVDLERPDERDVLVQVAAVCEALQILGHDPVSLACTLNLEDIHYRLKEIRPDLVFNLVESLAGQGRLIHFFPALLEVMELSYTGSSAETIYITSNKVLAKERMAEGDLPTPLWFGPYPEQLPDVPQQRRAEGKSMEADRLWIIKSLWEHASLGLDQSNLVQGSPHELATILCTNAPRLGGACFAELFVEGREFNLSLLAGPEGPEILPPAEIVFEGYGPQKARIVDYSAKWNESSFEYHHTYRRFDFPPQDQALIEELKEKADRCWQIFGLKGYGRIDFRVDDQGHLWILEINANPCLSPDAGFAAALSQAGLSFPDAVSRILNDALTSRKL